MRNLECALLLVPPLFQLKFGNFLYVVIGFNFWPDVKEGANKQPRKRLTYSGLS
jgi:hypothetical protein